MKKIVLILLAFGCWMGMSAQKFAVVDMEYVLSQIPSYETANEQLEQVSKKWQREVETLEAEARVMQKNYETEIVFLSDEMKKQRAAQIVAKEKEASDLKKLYFGAGGELDKKREALVKPILDEVYNALKEICEQHKAQMILDKSTATSIVYMSPKLDVSDELLLKLGYVK